MIEQRLLSCFSYIKNRVDLVPSIAIVLGSGLGNYANCIDVVQTIEYSEIPEFPISTTKGHKGRFVFGFVNGIPVVIMQGRVHYYEGYDIKEVVLPIRILHMLGANILILTNSSGGVNYLYQPGQLVLVKDHIACFVPNCLRGDNIQFLGPRFPDMSEIYSIELRKIIRGVALRNNIPMEEGVYLQTAGPSFESPSEIKMYRTLGADLVGMSTACEAIAAKTFWDESLLYFLCF